MSDGTDVSTVVYPTERHDGVGPVQLLAERDSLAAENERLRAVVDAAKARYVAQRGTRDEIHAADEDFFTTVAALIDQEADRG